MIREQSPPGGSVRSITSRSRRSTFGAHGPQKRLPPTDDHHRPTHPASETRSQQGVGPAYPAPTWSTTGDLPASGLTMHSQTGSSPSRRVVTVSEERHRLQGRREDAAPCGTAIPESAAQQAVLQNPSIELMTSHVSRCQGFRPSPHHAGKSSGLLSRSSSGSGRHRGMGTIPGSTVCRPSKKLAPCRELRKVKGGTSLR